MKQFRPIDDRRRDQFKDVRRRAKQLRCQICGRLTQEEKPLCTYHIARLPYFQKVMALSRQREMEIESVRRGETLTEGIVINELLALLAVKPIISLKGAAQELGIPQYIIRACKHSGITLVHGKREWFVHG